MTDTENNYQLIPVPSMPHNFTLNKALRCTFVRYFVQHITLAEKSGCFTSVIPPVCCWAMPSSTPSKRSSWSAIAKPRWSKGQRLKLSYMGNFERVTWLACTINTAAKIAVDNDPKICKLKLFFFSCGGLTVKSDWTLASHAFMMKLLVSLHR